MSASPADALELRHRRRMAPPRFEIVGAMYHVNGKAVHGMKLFADDSDRALFLRLLVGQARKSGWCVLAYTLMTSHYHVLFRLDKPELSTGFQRLNSIYARLYNRRHGRRGALWQRRYFDTIVEAESHLYEVIRYIALNAPRAHVCEAAEDWPWCGYGAAIGAAPPDPLVNEAELLRLFEASREEARKNLRWFVEEADPRARFGQTPVRRIA